VQVPLVVDEPRVTRVEEAVLVEALLGQLLHVPEHEVGALDGDLADRVDGQSGTRVAIDDPHQVPGQDTPWLRSRISCGVSAGRELMIVHVSLSPYAARGLHTSSTCTLG
jgi:hypothetical protein